VTHISVRNNSRAGYEPRGFMYPKSVTHLLKMRIYNDIEDIIFKMRNNLPESILSDCILNKVNKKNNIDDVSEDSLSQAPTSAQKWWASALLGMVFAIISSSLVYNATGKHALVSLLIHTVIFILLVRLILG